mmetsp:Transcript_16767/g.38720  ORF Transcript_16767/g.38720 Transcript_16767/m.38720 type:complete len:789 (+) Transcript_16767:121-2487(+)|eukprot:CAMPEP_0197190798 /NCGR_PEP_ID=MMETSP1423-20130617/22266_1 /TAXON_ID=476441 /ORGANISM="Pseudo-nitzschia heimii, Strain UNC1101" /LENGTH=788 /DNA_ID=CAMNT_0042643257 /DNA_START=107 /DNA_END=2473 /DNA_ORIENTATION=+
MALVSKDSRKMLKRHGKKLLKPKYSLYKKSKTAMRKLATTTKVLSPQIVLPRTLQSFNYTQKNTIRNVHTSLPATPLKTISSSPTKMKKKLSLKKLFGKRERKSSTKNTDNDGIPAAARKRVRKSMSAISPKTARGSPSKAALLKLGSEPIIHSSGNRLDKILTLTGSEETEATTNPNTPVRGDDEKTEATTNPNTPIRGSNVETNTENEHDQNEDHINDPKIDIPETKSDCGMDNETNNHASISAALFMDSSTSPSATSTTQSPHVFADDDDETEEDTYGESKKSSHIDDSTFVSNREASIYTLLEKELNSLEDRLRKKKEERRATVEAKLKNTPSDKEKDDKEADNRMKEVNLNKIGNKRQPEESQLTSACQTNRSSLSIARSTKQDPAAKKEETRSIPRMWVFLPAILLLIHWILLRVLVLTPSYDHDRSLENAQLFFEASTGGVREATKASTTPMAEINVVLSENNSELGRTIQDRLLQLGATVASVEEEGIDCTDLDSVAKSIDSLVEKLNHKVDFLIHTGNLCLGGSSNSLDLLTSESVQGYDVLFAGNYLSSFMVTQKILPRLEQSRFGTLVQFSSPISTLVDGSKLELNESSDTRQPDASVLLQEQGSFFSTMLRLPIGFAYAKLSETLQHKLVSQIYPNIRTIEITTGWTSGLLFGNRSANEFFYEVFRKEGEELLPSSTGIANTIAENEDLQDDLYEWSQTAVWKWIAPPLQPPNAEKMMGTHFIASNSEEENASAVVSSFFPANAAVMVTSSTLALLAVKVKNLTWDSSGNTWFSSE